MLLHDKSQCFLCGFCERVDIYKKEGLFYVMCTHCALVYLSSMPSAEECEAFYRSQYQTHRHDIHTYEEAVRMRERKGLEGKRRYLDELAPFLKSTSRVLEIGSGWGTLLKLIKGSCGSRVQGVEPGELASRVARDHYGLKIATSTFDEYAKKQKNKTFDAILMVHVLEHFPDPLYVLQAVKKLLASAGLLYIAVPNVARPNEPLDRFFHFEHCYYFTPYTLVRLLEKSGFKVLKLVNTRNEMHLLAVHESDSRKQIESGSFRRVYTPKNIQKILKHQDLKYKILRAFKAVLYTLLPRSFFGVVRSKTIWFLKRLRIIDI